MGIIIINLARVAIILAIFVKDHLLMTVQLAIMYIDIIQVQKLVSNVKNFFMVKIIFLVNKQDNANLAIYLIVYIVKVIKTVYYVTTLLAFYTLTIPVLNVQKIIITVIFFILHNNFFYFIIFLILKNILRPRFFIELLTLCK